MLRCVDVLNGASTAGSKLREKIISALHLPADVSADDILNGLLGWIHFVTLEHWRRGEPAWIKREDFDNMLHRLLRKAHMYRRLGLPEHLINVPKAERRRQLNQMYVRQLHLIDADELEVLSAVDDYYRSSSERFRLATDGDLTSDDWVDFDNQLVRHWRLVSGREKRAVQGRSPVETGYATYSATLLYDATLALDRPQPYLTRGGFHRLANEVLLGWHPQYESLCKK